MAAAVADDRPPLVIHRSRTDADALAAPPVRQVPLARWLAALADPRHLLELVIERPAYWEFGGAWSCPWRALNFHLLYLVVQGEGRLWLEDAEPRRIGPGTFFWLPPQTRHRLEQRNGRNYFLRFRLVGGGSSLTSGRPQVRAESLHLLPLFQRISDDLRFDHPWLAERLRGVLALLASDASGAEEQADADGGRFGAGQRRRLAQLVEERWQASLSPSDLARALGMSPTAFARGFRRSFACSPRRWLADQRLQHAAQRLLTDVRAVEQVAADAGFANPSQFARRFRACFGISPAAWRRRQGL